MTELPIVVNMTVDASPTEYDLKAETNQQALSLSNDIVIDTSGQALPLYEGPYTVTPSTTTTTLLTDGKRCNDDIVVSALNANSITQNDLTIDTSTGEITSAFTVSRGYSPIPFGAGKIEQLVTQERKTVYPTTYSQTAVTRGKFTTGAVTVRAMTTGTRGTPTATKGTVFSHSVAVTPSVTNTTGYITGSTITGTAVTVSASELVSGSLSITSNDTYDVTNYRSAVVNVSGGGGATVEALTVTANGTYTAPTGTAYSPVTVNVPLRPCDQFLRTAGYHSYTDSANLPNDFVVYYPSMTSCYQMFYSVTLNNITSITVKSDANVTNLQAMFNVTKLNPNCVITLDFDTSHVTNWASAFAPRTSGANISKTVLGTIDFSGLTASLTNMFSNNNKLETMTFAPNTLKYNFSMATCSALTDTTVISLANCLQAVSRTLTLHATPKGRLSSIMGTVTNNGTYDVFTEDAQGQTTLLSFITTTKGWTVA